MKKINVALIGYGYWGPNIARVLSESEDCELKYCADLNNENFSKFSDKYPKVITLNNYQRILKDKEVDAVLIATPTKTHYQVAKDCLNAKKHVFVEKPMTYLADQSRELIDIAKENNLKLMVGHVFLFNPAVRKIKEIINSGEIGSIRHLNFQRRNLGPIRSDVNAMWDLVPHDISMLLYFLDDMKPLTIQASGSTFLRPNIQDVVFMNVRFPDNIIANFVLSWLDPIKIRDITVVGDKKMVFFDDVNLTEKLKIFDKNADIIKKTRDVSYKEWEVVLKSGKIHAPQVEQKEPLKEEISHFIDCIRENGYPLTNGESGLRVVEILEAAQESLESDSKLINL